MIPDDPASAAPKHTREMPLLEEVSRRARQLWEEKGRPEGRDVEFWLEAERQVLGADPSVRAVPGGAVSAQQYSEATDANAAKGTRRNRGGRTGR